MADRRKTPLEEEKIEPQMCSTGLRLEILSQVPFFASLPHQAIIEINKSFHEVGYAAGEAIYFAGDPAEHLQIVAAGKIKLIHHTSYGKDVLMDFLIPGEFFGRLTALGDEFYLDSAQAQTSACVLRVSTDDFRKILDAHPSVALKVLDTLAERLIAAQEMVRQLSANSVEKRIAYTLLKLSEKLGKEEPVGLLIEIPLSRDDLAEMTGTTTETASRVMSQFQKDGLVKSGRQWVAITDVDGLENIAKPG